MNFEIVGTTTQYLKVDLQPGERVFGDSGTLISKSDSVIMTPRMQGGIGGVFARKMTGATGLLTEFSAKGMEGHVAVAGVYPGKVFAVDLEDGETFVSEQQAFLAAEESVKYTIQMMGLGAMWFGGEGIVMQKFAGPGKVFIHVVGDIIEYDVTEDNPIEVDPGHVAGFDGTLQYKVTFVDNVRTALFGGVGLFLATFSGKGRVITHSVSRVKLATQIALDAQQAKKK
jgi:uncharacterized protein (TIGR00266 family)